MRHIENPLSQQTDSAFFQLVSTSEIVLLITDFHGAVEWSYGNEDAGPAM